MHVILRYGELWLKSDQVKSKFLGKLESHIVRLLKGNGFEFKVRRTRGRLFVETDDKRALVILRRVFGLVSISPSEKVSLKDLEKAVVKLATEKLKKGMSFAMAVKRSGSHTFTSKDKASELGAVIVKKFGNKVNLTKPDLKISVEIINDKAYVFTDVLSGPGGLPLGAEGRVLALFSGSKQDALAAYMIMRRGCDLTIALTSGTKEKNKYLDILRKYDPNMQVIELPGDKITKDAIDLTCEDVDAKAVVSDARINNFKRIESDYPVLYPLITLRDTDINKRWSAVENPK